MDEIWIYHEKQFSLLCGQHCLNNLLQGPYFTAPDLATIGQELDAEERRMMLEAGSETADAIRFLAEDSGNVDNSGNFSFAVLNTALERGYLLTLLNTQSMNMRTSIQDLTLEEGYICNRDSHWFAVRKINGKWWNLNSTMERPEHVSDFYLDAFLGQLREEGYQVFVCRPIGQNGFPPLISNSIEGEKACWHREVYLLSLPKGSSRDDVAQDKWASAGRGHTLCAASAKISPKERQDTLLSEEEQLAAAIALSLSEMPVGVPEEPPSNDPELVRIQVRFPDGTKVMRRFRKYDSIKGLYAYAQEELSKALISQHADFHLVVAPEGRVLPLTDNDATFESQGLSPSANVFVNLR